jgi:hypothetical protein
VGTAEKEILSGISSGPDPDDKVVGAIRSLVASGSWSDQDWSEIQAEGRRLLVRNRPEVLEEVAEFLNVLRAHAARRFSIEAALVPASALEAAAPGAFRAGERPWLEGEALDRVLLLAGAKAAFARAGVAPGSKVKISPPGRDLHVVAHEVKQTNAIPVHQPVVELRLRGFFLEARVLPFPGGEAARVDLRLGRALDAAPPERRRLHTGEVELLSELREELRGTLFCPSGRTVVAGTLPPLEAMGGEAKPEPLACLVRVRVLPPLPAESPLPDLHFTDVAALLEPLPPFHLTRPQGPEDGRDEPGPLVRAGVDLEVEIQRSEGESPAPASSLLNGEVLVRGSREDASLLERKLAPAALPLARSVQIDLWLGTVEDAALRVALADPAGEATRKLLEGPGARLRLSGMSGAGLYLDSLILRDYLGHLEAVSGGTGDSVFELSDPWIAHFRQGFEAACRIDLLPGGREALLDLHLRSAGAPRFRKRPVLVADGLPTDAPLDPAPRRPGPVRVEIDLLEADSWSLERRLPLPLGRAEFLEAVPDGASPGRSRAVVALVTAWEVEGR